MEALTTTRCLEPFSYERLEMLGDSILKYAISCHLFLNYEKWNEGQLSALRAGLVSNVNLHHLATTRKLQVSNYASHCILLTDWNSMIQNHLKILFFLHVLNVFVLDHFEHSFLFACLKCFFFSVLAFFFGLEFRHKFEENYSFLVFKLYF
jgi:hypothetical protein